MGAVAGMGSVPGGVPGVSSRSGLAARLSKIAYANSVSDVLGVTLLPAELDAAAGGLPDDSGDGVFKHVADKQTSGEQHALAYFQVAEAAVQRVDVAALACALRQLHRATTECGPAVIRALGERLYRRPLERARWTRCWACTARGSRRSWISSRRRGGHPGSFASPQFLFRTEKERGGTAGAAARAGWVRARSATRFVPVDQRAG